MGEACTTHRRDKNAYKTEGNRPLGRPGRGLEENIRIDLREIR
jgi:hypothetical protein